MVSELQPCNSNPCMNNGTCETIMFDYVCHCVDGYNGTNCDGGKIILHIFKKVKHPGISRLIFVADVILSLFSLS